MATSSHRRFAGFLNCTSSHSGDGNPTNGDTYEHRKSEGSITPQTSRKGISTRNRLWRSLQRHKFAFRARSRDDSDHRGVLLTSETSPKDSERLFASEPNLASPTTSSAKRKGMETLQKIKKAIIPDSQSNLSPAKRAQVNHVEFASSHEIFPLASQSHSDLNSVEANSMRRQKSLESGHSNEDIFYQTENLSLERNSVGDPNCIVFLVKIHLKEGRDLVIRDASGSSDPYVRFKYRNKLMYKSNTIFKNLNPVWNEQISFMVDSLATPVLLEVYDYDRFAMDDFMGSATIYLENLELNKPSVLKLLLEEENSDQYMGYVNLEVEIMPQTEDERIAYFKTTATRQNSDSAKSMGKSSKVWSSIVNCVLVEGKDLLVIDTHSRAPLPDPYVKFMLGVEKYKSKPASKTRDPKWLEQFDLYVYDELHQDMQVAVIDKRTAVLMGRCRIDLSTYEREITHHKWYELEDGAGWLMLLITITGTTGSETVSDLQTYEQNPISREALLDRYGLTKSFSNVRDIGFLVVKVFKACGVAAADIGGKSDPFCVLELVNARLQTHTEYKTLNPEWNKIFTFNVKDIHSILEITVYDEDPDKKAEFLGKVAIPLLKIKSGEKRWYALKDRKLRRRAKGQILLELFVMYNPIKASIRTFNPREKKYMEQEQKFKRQVFMRNVSRVKRFALSAVEIGAFMASCWSWESPIRSVLSFIVFMVAVYFVELYMLPLFLLLVFIKGYIFKTVDSRYKEYEEYCESEDEDEDVNDKEEKKSIKERLQAVQDTLAMVQNVLDQVASGMERVKNTFNFTQPFLSFLAVFVLTVATIGLYFLPLRWIVMIWGINKFTKKLRSPHAIPNNELLDFLSRVPSDDETRLYGEFRPEVIDSASVSPTAASRRTKRPTT